LYTAVYGEEFTTSPENCLEAKLLLQVIFGYNLRTQITFASGSTTLPVSRIAGVFLKKRL
jgi:hypothetical protein